MQQYGLLHPWYFVELEPNFFPSLCTFGAWQIILDSVGEEQKVWTAEPTLTDIPCRLAPQSSQQTRGAEQEFVQAVSHVTLSGYYPQILPDMDPKIDGKLYAMEGFPEHDGGTQSPPNAPRRRETRFYVREVE